MAQKLKNCDSFESQIKVVVEEIHAAVPSTSKTDLKAASVSFYNKLVIADNYTPAEKLSGVPVTLVKAQSTHPNQDTIGNDYDLNKVSFVDNTIISS